MPPDGSVADPSSLVGIEEIELLLAQLQVDRACIVTRRGGPAGPGDRDHVVSLRQHPGQDDLMCRDAMVRRNAAEGRVLAPQDIGLANPAKRAPGQERDTEIPAVAKLVLARAKGRRELVLYADQVTFTPEWTGSGLSVRCWHWRYPPCGPCRHQATP